MPNVASDVAKRFWEFVHTLNLNPDSKTHRMLFSTYVLTEKSPVVLAHIARRYPHHDGDRSALGGA